jgi:hypothetical protein
MLFSNFSTCVTAIMQLVSLTQKPDMRVPVPKLPVTLIVHWKPRGLSGWPNAASYCFCRMRHRQVPTNKAQAKPNTYHDVIAGTRGSAA